MTNTAHIRVSHWVLTLGIVPVVGALLGWWFLFHGNASVTSASIVAGLASGAIDYARRGSQFCALVGIVAGALTYMLAYGLLIALLVAACSSGGCAFG